MAKNFGAAGSQVISVFGAKAKERGMTLDPDDLIVLDQAARVADIVAVLDAIIEQDGAVITTTAGTVKTNPALAESRAQRLILARLMADIDRRLGVAAQGGSNGLRGVYVPGDRKQNRQRGEIAAARRGQGRVARA